MTFALFNFLPNAIPSIAHSEHLVPISAAFKLQRDFKPRLPRERCAPELMELIKILFGVLVHPHQKKYIEWWKCGPVASGKSYFKLFSLYISPSSS